MPVPDVAGRQHQQSLVPQRNQGQRPLNIVERLGLPPLALQQHRPQPPEGSLLRLAGQFGLQHVDGRPRKSPLKQFRRPPGGVLMGRLLGHG